MSGTHLMKRIPRIKFPQRHPKLEGSPAPSDQITLSQLGATSQPPKAPSTSTDTPSYRFRSDVPAPPSNTAVGGKASLLPRRTPVSEKEIEAILNYKRSLPGLGSFTFIVIGFIPVAMEQVMTV